MAGPVVTGGMLFVNSGYARNGAIELRSPQAHITILPCSKFFSVAWKETRNAVDTEA
jgi:hypothetical protein